MSARTTDAPIDAVITWVDGDDPAHRQKLEQCLGWRARWKPKAAARTRYADSGELEYCVSSLLRFAPWLRRIFIVTDAQTPAFLNNLPRDLADRVRVVDHTAIFAGYEDLLPTFNSLSIETMLWRVPGLADRFIYFNDDCFLVKPVAPSDFFDDDHPVLRGDIRPLAKDAADKRLKRLFGIGRPSLRTLQCEAARLAGGASRFLVVGHVPHPMRVSTLSDYFASHPQPMRRNASYPLRNIRQFWTVALANNLEWLKGTARLSETPESLYLGSAPGAREIELVESIDERPECRFLCAQSLDGASEEFMAFWVSWMDRTVGRFQGDQY
ncbi:stealth family protein [Marinobacter sp. JSM 1782161]|uniref:stealth family protein n=1 Tax=Marinobacter sp. JSM 1782161 TaxID=2685906 RepID=UPI001401DA4B|nr:stealth family protein [Marinobacter sp. JSM 1782161]